MFQQIKNFLPEHIQGQELSKEDFVDFFQAQEGQANFYYGLVGSGKTYAATADIHEEIRQGHVVYATWPIKFTDTDDRKDFFTILFNIVLFWRKHFFLIPASKNFHYIDAEHGTCDGISVFDPKSQKSYVDWLNTLNHCSLYLDEAWRIMSHTLQTKDATATTYDLILVTRHKFRTVNVISQRTMNVLPTARGNMERFYKCEKLATLFGIPRFRRLEYQIMKGEDVDDSEEIEPLDIKTYWGSKKIFDSYNSWHFGQLDPIHNLEFQVYHLTWPERLRALVASFR